MFFFTLYRVVLLNFVFIFYLKGRVRFSICWLSSQIAAMAGAMPDGSQESGASFGSPTWVQRPKSLGSFPLLSSKHKELPELEMEHLGLELVFIWVRGNSLTYWTVTLFFELYIFLVYSIIYSIYSIINSIYSIIWYIYYSIIYSITYSIFIPVVANIFS